MTTPAVPAPAAQAAPAAPAPAPVAEPVAPAHEGIHAAKDKAEEFIKTFGQEPAAPVPPPAPRREDGTFAPKAGDPAGSPAPEAVAGEAPAAAPTAEVDSGTGEPPALPAEEFVDITFPGRRDGEELTVAFPKEMEEDARRIANSVKRTGQLEAERQVVAREAQMVRETQFIIQSDPVGFVMEQLDPTLRPDIVRHMLADPTVLEAVAADLEKVLDPATRENFQLKQRADRAELRDKVRTKLAETRQGEKNALELRENVLRLVPEAWNPEQVSTFLRDALLDLGQYAQTSRVKVIDPSSIPVILAARLRSLGLDPVLAAARMAEPRAAGAPPSGAPRVPASPAPVPRVTVKSLQAAAAATAQLATTPPAGPGSLPAGSPVKPPAGSSLKDASKHARASVGRS